MKIDELLNKYFEGETTLQEEQVLRTFFATNDVPDRLLQYKPLFAYFDSEIKKRNEKNNINEETEKNGNRKIILWFSAAAAVAAIMLCIFKLTVLTPEECKCEGKNYVMINGHCYTDRQTIRSAAIESLREMESLPDNDKELMKNQLDEMMFILNE